jgi:SulP family sulfate permease
MEEEVNPKTTQKSYKLYLGENVSFFNKANISAALVTIPNNSDLYIDYSKSKFIAHDVAELIKEYEIKAKEKNINVQKINFINT